MKLQFLVALSFTFSSFTFAGFSLSGQPEITEESYNAQLTVIKDKVLKTIKRSGSLEVYKDELSVAPVVVKIDFQKSIKVAKGASTLSEYSSWIDLEQATWGFQDAVNSAYKKITEKLQKKLGGKIKVIGDATKRASASFIVFPTKMPDLNKKMPNYEKTLVARESFGFDSDDNVKATNIELANAKGMEGVVFFPYINIALHKQSATTSQMNGELMINYVAAINGYFALCIKAGCFTATLPKNAYIDIVIPLVHRNEATSEKGQIAARKYGQELMAKMIAEFTIAAFDKLSEPE